MVLLVPRMMFTSGDVRTTLGKFDVHFHTKLSENMLRVTSDEFSEKISTGSLWRLVKNQVQILIRKCEIFKVV